MGRKRPENFPNCNLLQFRTNALVFRNPNRIIKLDFISLDIFKIFHAIRGQHTECYYAANFVQKVNIL